MHFEATVCIVSSAGYLAAVTKQPWREAAGYVDAHGRVGHLVCLYADSLSFTIILRERTYVRTHSSRARTRA